MNARWIDLVRQCRHVVVPRPMGGGVDADILCTVDHVPHSIARVVVAAEPTTVSPRPVVWYKCTTVRMPRPICCVSMVTRWQYPVDAGVTPLVMADNPWLMCAFRIQESVDYSEAFIVLSRTIKHTQEVDKSRNDSHEGTKWSTSYYRA